MALSKAALTEAAPTDTAEVERGLGATAGAPGGDRTVLVLRALGLGDFLTAVPALRAVRRAFPAHRLVLAAPVALEPLAELTGAVDALLPAAGLEPVRWSGPPPDVAVNLHGRGPQSTQLLAALRPQRLVAFANADAGVDGPGWNADEHEVSRWCRLVSEALVVGALGVGALGVAADPGDLDLPPPLLPNDHALLVDPLAPAPVVMHPGAAIASRRWPPERFAAVARGLTALGHRVVVTGSGAERELALEVAAFAGLPEHAVLAGSTDLRTLAALVSSARLVVCGDTGMAHLATALRTPSVVLFGPVSPARWGPPPRPRHIVIWHGDGSGDPWSAQVDPSLLTVSVEEVLAAASSLLRTTGSPTASGRPPVGAGRRDDFRLRATST